jgi:hypothetical protein
VKLTVTGRTYLCSGSDPNCKIKRFVFWRCEGCSLAVRNYIVPTIAHALSGDVYGLLSMHAICDAILNLSKIVLYA